MFKQKQEQMTISSTNNYDKFVRCNGNRQLNPLHLKRLKKSMSHKLLFSPIIVNEKYQVIDGQHRLEILKELKKPVDYILVNGYGLEEMQILNQTTKNWTADDFMQGYIELGNENYIKYKQFKDRYGWGHSEAQAVLGGFNSNSKYYNDFKDGEFKIKNYQTAVDYAERISMISPYYEGYKRRNFIYAMVKLFNNPNYNHATFLSKLQYQSTSLVDCTTVDQYLLLIEDIYNYKNRNKVSLRY